MPKFGGGNKCETCGKTVYATEEVCLFSHALLIVYTTPDTKLTTPDPRYKNPLLTTTAHQNRHDHHRSRHRRHTHHHHNHLQPPTNHHPPTTTNHQLKYEGKFFHAECFKCSICEATIQDVSKAGAMHGKIAHRKCRVLW